MLKLDTKELEQLEAQYPGIGKTIRYFEAAAFPACPRCHSSDTASVQCGIIGRTIQLAAATTKFKLIANGPKPGEYFCNACNEFFGQRPPTFQQGQDQKPAGNDVRGESRGTNKPAAGTRIVP